MSNNHNSLLERGPAEIAPSLAGSSEDSAKSPPKLQKSQSDRQEQSKKLVKNYMASLGPDSHAPEASVSSEKSSTLSVDEKKDRKRKINRLSAQRKRVRERVQLDTLTDRYAQINYRSEALKADNERLVKLVSSLKGTVNEAEMARDTGMSKETPTERSEYLLEKLNFVE
jgi:hypothetical protein